MKHIDRRTALRALAGLAGSSLSAHAFAQAQAPYPQRPIRVIVPFPPGGATDNSARVIGKSLTQTLGQPLVIDNRVGANGRLGTEAVAQSPADGYTLLLGGIGALTISPHLEKVPYDPLKDFTPISGLVTYDTVLIVHPSLPVKDVGQLVAYLRENGNRTSYASSGAGGPYHMAGELFKNLAGVEMTHVPYKGDGAAVLDLIGGNVQLMFTSTSAGVPHIKSGKARLIASGSSRRTPVFPDVKTIDEQGIKGYKVDAWAGLFGPAKLPAEVTDTLYRSVTAASSDKSLQDTIFAQGSDWIASNPAEFGAFVRSEYDKWGQLIRDRHLTI